VSSQTSHEGTCHCRAVGFDYRTAIAPEAWPIRACQCTFCRSHGALSTSDSGGSLRFVEHASGALNRYRFGRKTADFLLCRNCGAYLGAVTRSQRGSFGIVNVRVLHSLLDRLQEPERMNYDAETLAERQTRRENRWTPLAIG
jgi:hypothetical protein